MKTLVGVAVGLGVVGCAEPNTGRAPSGPALPNVVDANATATSKPDPERDQTTPSGDPIARWRAFLVQRFGAEPTGPAISGDFNGDGKTDFVIEIGDTVLAFHDTTGATRPTTWEVVRVHPQAGLPRAAPIERYQDAANLSAGKHALVFGDDVAPLVVFFHRDRGEYAWLQPIPGSLRPAFEDARKRAHVAGGLTPAHFLGATGMAAPSSLAEVFVGDFDGDGVLELAAVSVPAKKIYTYAAGSRRPQVQSFDYPAATGLIHKNRGTDVTPFPEGDDPPDPLHVANDFIELAIPETSSIYLVKRKGKPWKTVWISD